MSSLLICVSFRILCCVFLRIVYLMLQVSLDCPVFIASLIFSEVYLLGTN
jgi:hypothetical protein